MLILPILNLVSFYQSESLHISLDSAKGLTVACGDIPIIKGSSFEYYEPGWKKSYYESKYKQQTVKKGPEGSFILTFESDDGLASGKEIIRQVHNSVNVDYEFNWTGASAAKVEVTLGNIWAPVFNRGKVDGEGATSRIDGRKFKTNDDILERKFTPNSRSLTISSGLGHLGITSQTPLTLFDARGYRWADADDQIWLGIQDIDVSNGHPIKLHCVYNIELKPPKTNKPISISLREHPDLTVLMPNEDLPVLIPKPLSANLHFDKPLDITSGLSVSPVQPLRNVLFAAIRRRFQFDSKVNPHNIPVLVKKLQTGKPGHYDFTIQSNGIFIIATDQEGTRQAFERLASLCYLSNNHLCLPTGTINDEPQIAWRGVHLFVGPTAASFHKKMWDRFLKPLGFNHVVLQCERTSWKTLPGIDTPITMKRADLVQLFQYYRDNGVDPIPLVQSFGHAEWMFTNGKNLDLAMNPDIPYSLDPRKNRTREVLKALWNEIITTLKPNTVHFGLDEVDMRGWKPNPKFVTEMWNLHIPFLAKIADDHRVQMMLWGDKCLAPEQAVDAGFGDDLEQAEARRSVIPKNALIGDWHYAGNPDSKKFETSLNVWKTSGQRPIASSWFNSQNIRSFFGAAKSTKSEGALITTWAGYESSEVTMLAALKQYAAMIVAADYAWNPRSDPISSLPYDPIQVLKKMYFDEPSHLHPIAGSQYSAGSKVVRSIGRVNFGLLGQPIVVQSILNEDSEAIPKGITVRLEGKGTDLFLAMSTQKAIDEGKEVAKVEVGFEGKKPITMTLKYGLHLRAKDEKGICVLADRTDGISAIGIKIPSGRKIRYVQISQISRLSGLVFHGASIVKN